jgi:transposase
MGGTDALRAQGASKWPKRLHSELSYKRLEADRFVWPKQTAVVELTVEQLHWLLEGIDLAAMRTHPLREYRRVG